MGKVYIDTVKYLVYATLEIDGIVEKPDVVGAIFGQTEGLLGDELDLRELQKGGRIGRIEVDLQVRGGKTVGKVLLPSSLDMVETSILAAALETVDRVGPCEARIKVEKIEDTRNVKRKQVIEKAKTLLRTLIMNELPESKEISELVRSEVKIAEVQEYGPERLPAGPGIDGYDSLIVVEGRADVLNLLRNDIRNVIAIGGANVPNTIVRLSKEKEITVFLDGDRGGNIILKELLNAAEIDFVARAPPGKEVEELSRKELIKCLRARVPVEQEDKDRRNGSDIPSPSLPSLQRKRSFMPAPPSLSDHESSPHSDERSASPLEHGETAPSPAPQPLPEQAPIDKELFLKSLEKLENTLRAQVYDENNELKAEVPVRDLIKTLSETANVKAVVFDGIVTQRLVDLAEQKGVKVLVGVKRGNLFKKPDSVMVLTKE